MSFRSQTNVCVSDPSDAGRASLEYRKVRRSSTSEVQFMD
jgi:hypothetical protein